MQRRTKCNDCVHEGNCRMRSSLNDIIKRIIQQTEESVRNEIAIEMEYIIITDVTVLPTACSMYIDKKTSKQQDVLGFLGTDALVPV